MRLNENSQPRVDPASGCPGLMQSQVKPGLFNLTMILVHAGWFGLCSPLQRLVGGLWPNCCSELALSPLCPLQHGPSPNQVIVQHQSMSDPCMRPGPTSLLEFAQCHCTLITILQGQFNSIMHQSHIRVS